MHFLIIEKHYASDYYLASVDVHVVSAESKEDAIKKVEIVDECGGGHYEYETKVLDVQSLDVQSFNAVDYR